MISKSLVSVLAVGALSCAPTAGMAAEAPLADEDVRPYYEEHILESPSGIYPQKGWVFFHQRVPLKGDGIFAEHRALGHAMGRVRRDVFTAVCCKAARIPFPRGLSEAAGAEWRAQLQALFGEEARTVDVPGIGVADRAEDGIYVYALAVRDSAFENEAKKNPYVEKAVDIADAWRKFCEARRQENAVTAVRAILRESGTKVGIDAERKRYVFIGSCEREMDNPADDRKFLETREECALVAEIRARREMIKARRQVVSARDAARSMADESAAGISIASYYECLANEEMNGTTVLCSSESWDQTTKRYQVAVAVAWSEKLAAADKAPALGTEDFREGGGDDPEWLAWAKLMDFAKVFGTRTFKGTDGVRRFVGIGFSDIEGKTGAQLRGAYRIAQVRAQRNLAFLVRLDVVSKEILASLVQEVSSGNLTESAAWEKYESLAIAKCRGQAVRGHEVYEADVRHPLSGRLMHVSVCGLAETKR